MRLPPIQGATCLGPSAFRPDEPARSARDLAHEAHERWKQDIGRRIRFLEPPAITAWWIQNEITREGRASWHPRYGMTGTIIAIPEEGLIGAGPKVRWDDGHETWLGSVSQYEFI